MNWVSLRIVETGVVGKQRKTKSAPYTCTGIVVSAVGRVEWFAVCEVALLLVKSSAMQTEIKGYDLLIRIMDVSFADGLLKIGRGG